LSELNILVKDVTEALDDYDPTSASRLIQNFIDNLSNYYVRRNRRRFWKSENDTDKQAAYMTLYQCLVTVSKLLAPLVPFIAEELYRNLAVSSNQKAPESVHLTDFPTVDEGKIDKQLSNEVEVAIKISSLGRAARAKAGIKVRQPLLKLLVKANSKVYGGAIKNLSREILEEVNVKQIEIVTDENALDLTDYCVASDNSDWVAISTKISSELLAEGISREIVRRLQNMRRAANFEIADHITSYYQSDDFIAEVIAEHNEYISKETLSLKLVSSEPPIDAYQEKHTIAGKDVLLAVTKEKIA